MAGWPADGVRIPDVGGACGGRSRVRERARAEHTANAIARGPAHLRGKPAGARTRGGGAARDSLLRDGMTNVLLFLALMSPAPSDTVITQTVIDRIEEEWIVLDVPPHPSLPVPQRLGPSLHEGDALTVTVTRTVVGPFSLQGRDSRGLVLGDDLGSFHWPEVLAPPLEIGDRVTFMLVATPSL